MQNTEAIHCMLVPSFFPPGYYAGFGIAALKERSPQEKGEASVGVDRESCSGVGRRMQGEEKGVGRRMQTGRRGEQAFPESKNKTNKIIRKTGEGKKQNKMDKQEKNRKPVNQGKSYRGLHPGADLYQPHTDPRTLVASPVWSL